MRRCQLESTDRQSDELLNRAIYGKLTWTGQHIHFASFVPLRRKRNLVRFLAAPTENNCSDYSFLSNFGVHQTSTSKNGYLVGFSQRNWLNEVYGSTVSTAESEDIYLPLVSRGYCKSKLITLRLEILNSRQIVRLICQTIHFPVECGKKAA